MTSRKSELRQRLLNPTIFQIKLVHTAIFWVLSFCVAYALFSGVADRLTTWTWFAVGAVIVEGVVLVAFGGTCPLTLLAERRGAKQGAVADIFLPKWIADRIFPICGTTFGVAVLVILIRVLR
jgi:hypothetical protein